ncbi:MAG: glutamyl-tRNA reductase, partial [Gemmatimonadota bacterium]
GQVGVAYDVGRGRVPASVGPVLHRLFQSAAAAGGRVRAGTRIAHGSASIPSAAVDLARKVFGALAGRSVLVVGTGEIGALTARCLQAEGVGRIVVASRDLDRAARFARRIGGEPIVREDAWARVDEVDLVVTASRADGAFVAPSRLAERDGRRDLVVLDIALPRNVDPGVGDLPGVFLYNIDDLQRVVDAAEQSRTGEMEKAEAIVARHAARFWDWYRVRGAVPAIRRLREGVAALGRGALDDRLAEVGGEEDAEALRLATRAALNKILHVPTQALRVIARDEVASEHLEAVLGLLDRPAEASGGGSSEASWRRVANEGREGG